MGNDLHVVQVIHRGRKRRSRWLGFAVNIIIKRPMVMTGTFYGDSAN